MEDMTEEDYARWWATVQGYERMSAGIHAALCEFWGTPNGLPASQVKHDWFTDADRNRMCAAVLAFLAECPVPSDQKGPT